MEEMLFEEDVQRNNPITFGWNPANGYGGDFVWNFFLFLALVAI